MPDARLPDLRHELLVRLVHRRLHDRTLPARVFPECAAQGVHAGGGAGHRVRVDCVRFRLLLIRAGRVRDSVFPRTHHLRAVAGLHPGVLDTEQPGYAVDAGDSCDHHPEL